MDHLIETWKSSTISQFKRRMELIRITTMRNHLMNRLSIFFQREKNGTQLITEPRTYGVGVGKCNCGATNHTCTELMKIYEGDGGDRTAIYTIPNFFLGCYLVEALFLSTLECFYSEACMMGFLPYFNSPLDESWTYPALESRLNSANKSIESIVDQLMVDEWSPAVNFTSYYYKCAPSTCTIEYNSRQGLLTIAIIIIGIFGGLSIGFQLLIWLGLRLIEKFINGFSLQLSLLFVKQIFGWNDEQKLKRRLHIILVIVILYGLYMRHAFRPKLIEQIFEKPSLAVYENLTG
ncbi:unnamed protein product, partial [Adineta steineri]